MEYKSVKMVNILYFRTLVLWIVNNIKKKVLGKGLFEMYNAIERFKTVQNTYYVQK